MYPLYNTTVVDNAATFLRRVFLLFDTRYMQALSVPERFEGASRREYPGIPMHAITSVYCCSSLVRQISVPSLAYRRLRGDAIEVYKYLKGIYRVDSSRMLPLAGLKTFETRGHLLKIQKRYCRTKLRANFFSFRIVNM